MRRELSAPRPDFEAQAKAIGFHFASVDGEIYWDESARYVFSLREIESKLEAPTQELHGLCLRLVERVVASEDLLRRLKIPPFAFEAIRQSWERRDPSLYGRFDFAYGGEGDAKLLEYNADTPTSLFESAVVQWFWVEQMIERGQLPKGADQFNSLHERLIARWREIGSRRFLHLSCMTQSIEDAGTVSYLDVITTQNIALTDERTAAQVLGRRMEAAVDLIKAVGGGWDQAQLPYNKPPTVTATRPKG